MTPKWFNKDFQMHNHYFYVVNKDLPYSTMIVRWFDKNFSCWHMIPRRFDKDFTYWQMIPMWFDEDFTYWQIIQRWFDNDSKMFIQSSHVVDKDQACCLMTVNGFIKDYCWQWLPSGYHYSYARTYLAHQWLLCAFTRTLHELCLLTNAWQYDSS